jgi:hypothetical protein
VGFGAFSKTRTIFFGRRLAVGGERLNSLQATTGGAVACLMNFTELKTIDDQVRLSVTDPGSMKKRCFIEIDS